MLFAENLKRLDLLSGKANPDNKSLKISVYRNHSFELLASVLNAFLNFSNYTAEFSIGAYDDSLSFADVDDTADINLIWLDISRYKTLDIAGWVKERILALKKISKAKILFYHTGEVDLSQIDIADVIIADLSELKIELGDAIFDLAKQELSGTRLSNKACLYIAREIGLRYIPALLKPALKALVLDLDNTLYSGVLGEDGANGVKPFMALQKYLKALKDKGFFLAIASKNEFEDAKELFEIRTDFPLKWEDFSAFQINWDAKPQNIEKISKTLNIGLDSILFLDDNIGELEKVRLTLPSVKVVEALSETISLNTLKYYPCLYKSKTSLEDNLRTDDIKANQERQSLQNSLSEEEYFKNLGIKLTYEVNPQDKVKRISELLNKTNQFIFSYQRYTESQVEELLNNKSYCTLAISMSDKLSDSGIIAILVAHTNTDELQIDELVVSCRALGRNIENKMIFTGVNFMLKKFGLSKALLAYKKGDRNAPALRWLEANTPQNLQDSGNAQLNSYANETAKKIEIIFI